MNTGLPLLAIGLVLGGGIGFTIAAANGISKNPQRLKTVHDHSLILTLADSLVSLRLAVETIPDPDGGWNLHIQTENFTFRLAMSAGFMCRAKGMHMSISTVKSSGAAMVPGYTCRPCRRVKSSSK